jgi:hypothetical protein
LSAAVLGVVLGSPKFVFLLYLIAVAGFGLCLFVPRVLSRKELVLAFIARATGAVALGVSVLGGMSVLGGATDQTNAKMMALGILLSCVGNFVLLFFLSRLAQHLGLNGVRKVVIGVISGVGLCLSLILLAFSGVFLTLLWRLVTLATAVAWTYSLWQLSVTTGKVAGQLSAKPSL